MPEQIVILTGEIHSGKTTKLLQWCQNKKDVYGIATPVAEGLRYFCDVHSGEQFQMEAGFEEDALVVGRFRFSKNCFRKAISVLDDAIAKSGWLVLDEIGPLELRGEGFCEITKKIIAERSDKIIFVVRRPLLEEVVGFFRLDKFDLSVVDVDGNLP